LKSFLTSKQGNYSKGLFLLLLLITGLLTKLDCVYPFINNYIGGIIYVIFFIILTSIFYPNSKPLSLSFTILIITSLLEFSQLIQNKELTSLRSHFLIRALIGSVFNVFDFIFYFLGAITGFLILIFLKQAIKTEEYKTK
jgi:hypothetical protein